jgi:hypothetical protein
LAALLFAADLADKARFVISRSSQTHTRAPSSSSPDMLLVVRSATYSTVQSHTLLHFAPQHQDWTKLNMWKPISVTTNLGYGKFLFLVFHNN